MNRLAKETSPYLLQHAENPVDWYPWGEDAFKKASDEQKPIFLSIGYSSCHWCHVMEHEVFEKPKAAEALNQHFVSIKVDREERADVDHFYMDACMALTGSGGWPLTVFLTPEKEPFFTRTYLPLDAFLQVANTIAKLWQEDPTHILDISKQVLNALKRPTNHGAWDNDIIDNAFHQLQQSYDPKNGGFGSAPKFPIPHTLMFLQRYGLRYKNEEAISMAKYTLHQMIRGGIFDHVGGGFFRYSTDYEYLIPHFEKMLYDNAMLLLVYTEFGDYSTSQRIIDFCMRELYATEGAFYTALDADSEGQEGLYYLFSMQEVQQLLPDDWEKYCDMFNITDFGNFEGKNHLNLLQANANFEEEEEFATRCHQVLLEYRNKRIPPLRDDKILLSSNSLMLAALSTFAKLTQNEEYLNMSVKLAEFLTGKMQHKGRFYTSYSQGKLGKSPAISEDYAYLAWGLFSLHQATLDEKWLNECKYVCEKLLELFVDSDGLFWMSGKDVTDLPQRSKNTQDGALPSGIAIASDVFQRLFILTGCEEFQKAHSNIKESLSGQADSYPTAYTAFLSSMLLEEKGVKVELPAHMYSANKSFYPFASFCKGDNAQAILCTTTACLPPIEEEVDLIKMLDELGGR